MRFLVLAAAVFALVGCDSDAPADCPGGPDCPTAGFDPDTVDFDALESLDFERYVRPLLDARDALAAANQSNTLDYAYAELLDAGPSGLIVPFDGAASLLVRLARETLADSSAGPLPNLKALQEDEVRFLERWIDAGARADADSAPAYADASSLLYICNQLAGRVQILDADRRRVIRHVDFEALGQPANAKPHHVVTEPDGSAWYVALISGDGGGSVLKLSSSLDTDPSDAEYLLAEETPEDGSGTFQKPGMLALDAAQGRLYAGRSFSADPTSSGLANLDRATMAFETIVTPDVHPHALGVSRDGRWVFTAGLTAISGQTPVYVYDTQTGDLSQQFVPGAQAFVHFAVSPDGATVVLTAQTGAALYVFDFDTSTGELVQRGRVAVGQQPWHPLFAPDGARVYVPNRLSNTVSVVDPAALAVVDTLGTDNVPERYGEPFSQPHGTALSADGRTLYVSNRNLAMTGAAAWVPPFTFATAEGPESPDLYGNVVVIDLEQDRVVDVIQTGRFASGLALDESR